jgi:hypothetical protein
MSSSISNSKSDAATVRFNVGGTIYEVSRSLLEQHPNTMLTRMVSKTWFGEEEDNERKDEALFIDRSGVRFEYVLDFMRDGPKVSLPVTISKEGFLKDLDYFGFDNVVPDDISMLSSYSVYMDTVKKMDELETKGAMESSCSKLAHYFFLRFKTSNSLVVDMNEHNVKQFYRSEHMQYQNNIEYIKLRNYSYTLVGKDEEDKACLNKHMNAYNLKLLREQHNIYHLGIASKSS